MQKSLIGTSNHMAEAWIRAGQGFEQEVGVGGGGEIACSSTIQNLSFRTSFAFIIFGTSPVVVVHIVPLDQRYVAYSI